MANLKEIEKKAVELGNDVELVKKELKRVQSLKCRLLKQKGRPDYELTMRATLDEEQLLKEVRSLLEPKEKTVTTFEQADVDQLDYEQTMRALESIRSKKANTRWLTMTEGDNDEFRSAVKIEAMLLEHKKNVAPIEDTTIRKTDLITVIDTIERSGNLSTDRIVELLKGLL